MEIKLYFQMLKRGWWFVLVGGLAFMSVSLIVSYFTQPIYTAVSSFIIIPSESLTNVPDVVNGLEVLGNTSVVTTYAEIMNSNRIYSDTLDFLNLNKQNLTEYTYVAVSLPSTSVVELSVSGPDPNIAADLANALGYQTIAFIRQLNSAYDLEFLDAAVPPTIPVSPQPMRDASIALLLGIVVGGALVILREEIRIPIEAYRQRSRIDSMTGVFTIKYFLQVVEESLAESPDELMSIGIIELNGLRDLIETLPVASLQSLMHNVTRFLQKTLRGNDVIGRLDEVSFIIMLPSTSGVAASGIFEKIYQTLSHPAELGYLNSAINLDPHIGGAEYSNNISIQDLLDKAKEALLQARRDLSKPVYIWSMRNPFWTQNEAIR